MAAPPRSTALGQFSALWLKQWRLTRRSYISFGCNILVPILVLLVLVGFQAYLSSQLESFPATRYPSITPPWFLYQRQGVNETSFVPPATFTYASDSSVSSVVLGSFGDGAGNGSGLLGAIISPNVSVKFVQFNEQTGELQPNEILRPVFNFELSSSQSSLTEEALLSELYSAFSNERPPTYVAAYLFQAIDFTSRNFSYQVLVNSSISNFADLISATALIDEGISALLNQSFPGVAQFLGFRTYPFLGGKLDQVDSSTSIGPFLYIIMLSMLLPIFVNLIVHEKENRLLELMKMNGLRMSVWWTVNYVFCYALYVCVAFVFLIAATLFRLRFFTQSSPLILVLLFLFWGLTLVSLSFMLSTFFSRSQTATIVCYFYIVAVAFICRFLMETWIRNLGSSIVLTNIFSIWPPFAMYRAMIYIAMTTASYGRGIELSDIADPDMNILLCYGYLLIAAVIMFLLSLYLGEILPSEYGVKRSPLFLFQRSFWCPGGRDAARELDDRDIFQPIEGEPLTVATERRVTLQDRSAMVRVLGLSKTYDSGKIALRDIVLRIEQGVCLGLLGSNGAGKTTLISMLCGLFSPSSGDAIIDGFSIKSSMDEIHRRIGVCPQMNVLWDDLTGEEHLYFFGRLKGLTGEQLDRAVRRGLEGVRLWSDREKLSRKYSGGMKRRLAVAIALIADPKVVFLDEPSTGLDPVSRQTLWECIRTSKVGKAVVLTTHSMEEAEVLCDHHAVFCDGKLRAVGFAADLKRIYAPSLRLSINTSRLLKKRDHFERCMEEIFPFSKQDPSKTIADFTSYMLPANTPFSRIFEHMNRSKAALGIDSWAVSNATLEEVFFAVLRMARLVDSRLVDGSWTPNDVSLALSQTCSPPELHRPNGVIERHWGTALMIAYYSSQPEEEQQEWSSLADARRAFLTPQLLEQAMGVLNDAQLMFQG